MIVFGCIARNYFGSVVKPYNNDWAQWFRVCCLGILLARGGMNINFTGKGITVVLLTFIPMIFEATTIALIATAVLKMPLIIAYANGFALSSVAATIIVPQLLRWDALGYGKDKGIVGTLIASCTFDNIANIILFNICKTIAFEYAE